MKRILIGLVTLLLAASCSFNKDNSKSSLSTCMVEEEKSEPHIHRYVYIDRMNVLHLEYRGNLYEIFRSTGRNKEEWNLCPDINIGYKRIPIREIKGTNFEFVCPTCVGVEEYEGIEQYLR